MTDQQWRELVEKTKKGDKQAFEALYRETNRSVYFTALKLLANEENARDVMQDTFMTAIEKLSALEDGAKFPKWINGIAVKKCLRYFRRTAEESLDEKTEQGYEIKDDDTFIPEEYVTDAVRRKVVTDIISDTLSDVQRQTVIMYYYDEMSLDEISEVMDCPAKTVSSRLCAARDKIREAVLIYESKQGDKLHAVVPVPILTLILRKEAESFGVPDISAEIFLKAVIDAAAKASAGTITAGNAAAAGGSAMTKVLTGKVIAGILAVTVAGGGVTAAVIHSKNSSKADDEDRRPETSVTTVMPEVQTTTAPESGDPFPAASYVPESEQNNGSVTPYEPIEIEMDPEMKARLDELRASGAETVEVRWGTRSPIPFTEQSTGENVDIRCNGTFTYFPEVNGDMNEETMKANLMDSIQISVINRSGHFDAEDLPAESGLIKQEVTARLANEAGILLDSFNIASITKPPVGSSDSNSQVTAAAAAESAAPAAPERDYGDLFFNLGHKEAYAYKLIYMLPLHSDKGAAVSQYVGGSNEWYDGNFKEYVVRFSDIRAEYRKEGLDPAQEIKKFLVDGYDYGNSHFSAFADTILDNNNNIMSYAFPGSLKIESITDEEKVTVLGHDALKIKGYFTYRDKNTDKTEKCYFAACIGTYDIHEGAISNDDGRLPYYMMIAFTQKEYTNDAKQQAQCEKLIDVAIPETYYKDDPNAPKPD